MLPDAAPVPTTLDLTGLPEPVARDLVRLVHTLREKLPSAAAPPARPPLFGRFADPARPIPAEMIDEAQAELWAGFPRDLPAAPAGP